jgi:hypothetical protein
VAIRFGVDRFFCDNAKCAVEPVSTCSAAGSWSLHIIKDG